MGHTSQIAVFALGLGLTGVCRAQTVPYSRDALTNRDVVVLAKAGFNEDFIIETIQGSRTQFDVRVDGLADLAKQGITERLIRVMMNCGETRPGSTALPGEAVMVTAPAGVVMTAAPSPPAAPRTKQRPAGKPAPVGMAISTQTPYYEWTSYFWGLWKRKIGVGAVMQQPSVAQHLGGMYQDVRAPRQYYAPRIQEYQPAPVYTVQTAIQP